MNVVFNTNEQFNVSFEHTDTFIIDLCEYQADISFVTDDDFQVSFDEGETFNCQFDVGGGGASNIVQGEFTTGSSGASTGTFTIPYTGNGYPISLMIVVKGGAYNNSSSGDTTWYNSVNRYDAGAYYMTKSRIPSTPTYVSGADSQGVVVVIYKNSTSQATSYSRTVSMNAWAYNTSSANASTGANCVRFKGNGKTVSYYVGNRTSSTVGLARDTTFQYIAVYSE